MSERTVVFIPHLPQPPCPSDPATHFGAQGTSCQQGAPRRPPLTFAVRLGAGMAAHEAGRAVGRGRGARRRAGGGGQALVRGGVVQGPVACERRGRRLVLVQAAPQPRGLQAEGAPGWGPRARVQR